GVDREPGAHRLLGLRQAVLAVEPHILEQELVRHQSLTTGFLRLPMESIRTSTRSPGRSGPTPGGVPVALTSPGSSVITCETRAAGTSRQRRLTTTASSASCSTRTEIDGYTIGSSGPTRVVVGLKSMTGSSGIASPSSVAWSR